MRALARSWLFVVLAACSTPPPVAPTPSEAPAPVVDSKPDWATVHGHMREHLIHLDTARQALISGDMDKTRASFGWLASHKPVDGLPEGWLPHVEAMQGAATRGTNAQDFYAAGHALGRAAEACGACHAANNAKVTFPVQVAPVAKPGSVGHMKRHAWAADRMWEGLIQPSDERWEQGVRMLNEHALEGLTGGDPLPPEVREFGKRVHAMSLSADEEYDPTIRALLYGNFLSQCAACHTSTGHGPQ